METSIYVTCYLLLGCACCHAEQDSRRSGRGSRLHQAQTAGSQQSAVGGLAPAVDLAFLLLILLENVEVVMRSSAGSRTTAGDKPNATMQHAARENIHMHTNHYVPGACNVRIAAI